MPKFQQKIINEIKHITSEQVNTVADYIFLLSQILNQHFRLSQINRYILEYYSHNKFQWKTIPTEKLFQIYQEGIEYIKQNRQKWQKIDQFIALQNKLLLQEKKKIKKIIKQKALGKEDLIDSYLQQIRRNKEILLKSKDQGESIKYNQNIETLEKRIQIIRSQNFQNQSELYPQKQTFLLKQDQLVKIAKQFELKTKKIYQEDIMEQNKSMRQKILRLQRRTTELRKKLSFIYHHYSKQNYNSSQTFQSNKKNLQTIDLRLFLKYYRDFDFFLKDEQKYQIVNITNLFKKIAVNGKYIDLEKFVQIHSQLLNFSFNNSTYQKLITHQLLKDQEVLKRKNQIQSKLNKIQQIKTIFSQQKTYQVLNIKRVKRINKEKKKNIQQNLNRFIDKTSEDYAKTRQIIYEELRKNKYQNLNSQKKYKLARFNPKYIESYSNSTIQNQSMFRKNNYIHKNIFQTITEQANEFPKKVSNSQIRKNNPQHERQKFQTVKKSKSSLSFGTHSQFTLPKLTRLSEQRIQSQSIYKSLEYLNGTLGKKQSQKIRKILEFEKNLQSNKIQNDYLKKYFDHQKQENYKKQRQHVDQIQKKTLQQRKNCPKYKSSDYQPFMKF